MRSSDVWTLPLFLYFLASLQTKATSKREAGVQTDGDQVKKKREVNVGTGVQVEEGGGNRWVTAE